MAVQRGFSRLHDRMSGGAERTIREEIKNIFKKHIDKVREMWYSVFGYADNQIGLQKTVTLKFTEVSVPCPACVTKKTEKFCRNGHARFCCAD